jgi:hypothetical protein
VRTSIKLVRLSDIHQAPIRHQSLAKDLMPRIEATYRAIGHYQCPSLEQWELGFMRDTDPESEVAVWEVLAKAFQFYKQKCWKGGRLKRKRASQIIAALSMISWAQPLSMIKENAAVSRQLLQCFNNAGGVAELPIMQKASPYRRKFNQYVCQLN